MRKGSKWWDERVKLLVKDIRRVFGQYLQGRSANDWGCTRKSGRR